MSYPDSQVYPSSEDTHLLIDVLESDKALLQDAVSHGGICFEVGYVLCD